MLLKLNLRDYEMSSGGSVGEHNGRTLKLPTEADNAGGFVVGESIRQKPSKYENERILPQI